MRPTATALLTVLLVLGGCAAHEPPRCTGPLEQINPPVHSQKAPDSHEQ